MCLNSDAGVNRPLDKPKTPTPSAPQGIEPLMDFEIIGHKKKPVVPAIPWQAPAPSTRTRFLEL